MQKSNTLPKQNNANPIHWFKWIIFVVVLTIIAFPLWRFIKSQIQKNQEKTASIEKTEKFISNQNPITQQFRADQITKDKTVQMRARNIAKNLGTIYSDTNSMWSWLNPKGWTENDKQVADDLIKGRNNYKLIQRLYFECYSNSRNLNNDILEFLDTDELKRVQKYLKI